MSSPSFCLAGIVGWPVAHSRSPRLHNYWLEKYGLPGAYVQLPVAPGKLAQALPGLAALGFRVRHSSDDAVRMAVEALAGEVFGS